MLPLSARTPWTFQLLIRLPLITPSAGIHSVDLKEIAALLREAYEIERLEAPVKGKEVTRANEGTFECLYAKLQPFAETNFKRFTAADCYRFLGVPENTTPQ